MNRQECGRWRAGFASDRGRRSVLGGDGLALDHGSEGAQSGHTIGIGLGGLFRGRQGARPRGQARDVDEILDAHGYTAQGQWGVVLINPPRLRRDVRCQFDPRSEVWSGSSISSRACVARSSAVSIPAEIAFTCSLMDWVNTRALTFLLLRV